MNRFLRVLPLKHRPPSPVLLRRHISSAPSPTNSPLWFLLADIHLSDKTLPRLTPFFNFLLSQFSLHKPTHVLFLGDTFNVRRATDPVHHRIFTELLRTLISAPWGPQVHLLVGNHDMKNAFNRADNSLVPFSLASGKVNVYSSTTSTSLDGVDTVFIPYHIDETPVRDFTSSQPPETTAKTVAFYHGAVKGAVINGANDTSRRICTDSQIGKRNLGLYKRTFLGHFHTHGVVSDGKEGDLVYVGSPIQSNMGDAGDLNHGFVIYRPLADTWELVRNPEAEHFLRLSHREALGALERLNGKKVQVALEREEGSMEVEKLRDILYEAGAEMVDIKSPTTDLPPENVVAQVEAEAVPLGNSVPEMVQSFMDSRKNTISPDVLNLDLEKRRREFFLEFIKHNSPVLSTSGSVFQGDLLRVEMHNFRGVKGTAIFDLQSLPPAEVFLVSGVNGSGKSTIVESIVWCLFGEFPSKKVPVEEIMHAGETHCYVRLFWGNGYIFERSRKVRGARKHTFQIINPDGQVEEHGHDAATTTKYLIENILHMDLSMFKQTVIIGDNAEYFVRAAGERGRTEAMDAMFGLDCLSEYRKSLLLRSKEVQVEIQNLNIQEGKLRMRIDSNQVQHDTRLAEMRREVELARELTVQVDILQRRLVNLPDKEKKQEQVIQQFQTQLDTLRDQQRMIHTAIQLLSNRRRILRDVERVYQQLKAEKAEKAEKDKSPLDDAIQAVLLSARHTWTSLQVGLTTLLLAVSPKPKVTPPPPKRRSTSSPPKLDFVSRAPEVYHPIRHTAVRHTLDTLSDTLDTQNHSLRTLLYHEQTLTNTLRLTTTTLRDLNQTRLALERELATSTGKLQQLNSQRTHHTATLQTLHTTISDLHTRHATLTSELPSKQHQLDLVKFWQDKLLDIERDKGDFLTHCRSSYIQRLNSLLTSILASLTSTTDGLSTTHLAFVLTPSFQLLPTPTSLSLHRRSRGQTTRTFLALFLAMFVVARARLPFRPRFLFMDEIIDALDVEGIEGLQRWLGQYAGEHGVRAFLLTHREPSLTGKVVEVVRGRRETRYNLRDDGGGRAGRRESRMRKKR